ncbi:hypothetical protein V1525DRAFT_405494 [Lipomyces kononenkoae]|uniref:Uncharacterized protein n=1 Tax=Lipomyces kononenkoae TaxID=34357 RepID=A0ACC3SZX0_LIPKO
MPLTQGPEVPAGVPADPDALLEMLSLNQKARITTEGPTTDDDEEDAVALVDDIDDIDDVSASVSVASASQPRTTPSSPLAGGSSKTANPHLAYTHPHLGTTSAAAAKISRPASPYTLNPPIDYDGLSWPSVGTRGRLEASPEETAAKIGRIADAVRVILTEIGEDPTREGLLSTPERYAKAIMFFTRGYEQNIRNVINRAVFEEDHDEMVIVKDIPVFSLCEHHMVPFTGTMSIGYIPNSRVLGLSKLARIAEMFARRLQVQERLTKQVALAVWEILRPQGVAVVMEASHMCMVMRGVQKPGSTTVTSCMLVFLFVGPQPQVVCRICTVSIIYEFRFSQVLFAFLLPLLC